MTSVKNQLKNKLKDYKQRLENVASLEDRRSQVSQEYTGIYQRKTSVGQYLYQGSARFKGEGGFAQQLPVPVPIKVMQAVFYFLIY